MANKIGVVQSNKEQQTAAHNCGKGFCCLGYQPGKGDTWTWYVALATDDVVEADEWWEDQTGLARVYYANGAIRNAK